MTLMKWERDCQLKQKWNEIQWKCGHAATASKPAGMEWRLFWLFFPLLVMRESHPDVVKTAASATSCASASTRSQQPIGSFSFGPTEMDVFNCLWLDCPSRSLIAEDPKGQKNQRAGGTADQAVGRPDVCVRSECSDSKVREQTLVCRGVWFKRLAWMFHGGADAFCCHVHVSQRQFERQGFWSAGKRPLLHLQCRSKRGRGRKKQIWFA